jgi:large repetitive protein
VEVAAGYGRSVARLSDGSVIAWGYNVTGQWSVPALPSGLTYVEVAAGLHFTVARKSDGSVVARERTPRQCSVPLPPSGRTYVEVAASGMCEVQGN